MKIFISGGCKNGKSFYAQQLAFAQQKKDAPLYYIATMVPVDDEDKARIKRHKFERRGMGFQTIEINRDIERICRYDPDGTFLLDSTTALLANEMFSGPAINFGAAEKICVELSAVLERLSCIVIVSDFIYADASVYDPHTEAFRRGLASIDRLCVQKCNIVIEVCYGNAVVHKGVDEYSKLF